MELRSPLLLNLVCNWYSLKKDSLQKSSQNFQTRDKNAPMMDWSEENYRLREFAALFIFAVSSGRVFFSSRTPMTQFLSRQHVILA